MDRSILINDRREYTSYHIKSGERLTITVKEDTSSQGIILKKNHPITKEKMEFLAPIPQDMQEVISLKESRNRYGEKEKTE